jgi:proteasome accessory factor B
LIAKKIVMAKREYIQRHLLIIKRLKKQPSSFKELQEHLIAQQELTGENFDKSQRTFQRDIKDIATIYGVEIKNNKKEGYYEIVDEEEDKPFERIIEAFETLTALNISNHVGNKIIVEHRPNSGTAHMQGILYAIDNNKIITFKHQSYWNNEPTYRKIQPLVIKEAQNRWYLIGYDIKKQAYRNFGLDRMSELEISNLKGSILKYKPEVHYQHAFGIETYEPAERIVLECSAYQAQYIKSLPLHKSQKVTKETDGMCVFELFMHPTHDFIMEILKHGDSIKIIEPQILKNAVKSKIHKMMELYSH